jgi:hypothetical protein
MTLKSVGVLSCAKMAGLLYALMGLIFGALFSFFSLLGMAIGSAQGAAQGAFIALFFGLGAIVILPIFYGAMGFVFVAICAALYNVLARSVGGIELELE